MRNVLIPLGGAAGVFRLKCKWAKIKHIQRKIKSKCGKMLKTGNANFPKFFKTNKKIHWEMKLLTEAKAPMRKKERVGRPSHRMGWGSPPQPRNGKNRTGAAVASGGTRSLGRGEPHGTMAPGRSWTDEETKTLLPTYKTHYAQLQGTDHNLPVPSSLSQSPLKSNSNQRDRKGLIVNIFLYRWKCGHLN